MSTTLPTADPHATAIGRVVLKPNKGGPFFAGHPWVHDSSIGAVVNRPADGGLVDVVAENGRFVARGIFNSQSRIRVRLYSWQQGEELDAAFWRKQLETAFALRRALAFDAPASAARLVFSEADGLSGIIVDRFGPHLVVQITALAMSLRSETLLGLLTEMLFPASISLRTDRVIAEAEGMEVREGCVHGALPEGPLVIEENGLKFQLDLHAGQKTGFYLDQRENRAVAARYLVGRRVLDVCCYSGGFSLAAAVLGKCPEVIGLDTSEKALALARENAALNGAGQCRFEQGDCFDALEALGQRGERFGGIVLDPPRFARERQRLDQALRAYHRLNRLAVQLLEPGGILVTCSCSGTVGRDEFLRMLSGVAQKSHRQIQLLEVRGAAPDHPVRTSCPESEYLKCVICRVV